MVEGADMLDIMAVAVGPMRVGRVLLVTMEVAEGAAVAVEAEAVDSMTDHSLVLMRIAVGIEAAEVEAVVVEEDR